MSFNEFKGQSNAEVDSPLLKFDSVRLQRLADSVELLTKEMGELERNWSEERGATLSSQIIHLEDESKT